jgi:FlaA1/EpsC-like NDP-sugar epimerase
MIILTLASRQLRAGKITYTTIIIGGNQKAFELYEEMSSRKKSLGNRLIGFIDSETNGSKTLTGSFLPRLGNLDELANIIQQYEVEEALIAIETSEHNKLKGSWIFFLIIMRRYWLKSSRICMISCSAVSR